MIEFANKKIYRTIFVLISFLITFITDRAIFDFNSLNIVNYSICKVLLLIILFFIWKFFFKLLKKDAESWSYFKYFIIYMIPILILFVFVYPGNWFPADVYNIYNPAIKADFYYFLNYLTSIFYIIGYMLFPVKAGNIILLIVLFGIIFSYIFKNFMDMYKSKLVYLLFIPFFMFKTITYTFYANRPIMCGMIYLLLLIIIIIDKIKGNKLSNKKLVFLSFLTGLLSCWRTEYIYLLLAIPLFIFIVYKLKVGYKNVIKILGICLLSYVLISIPQIIQNKKHFTARNLPSYIGPLSYMLTMDLEGENLEEDLNDINKVIDIKEMKKYASYDDTICIYRGHCLKEYKVKSKYYDEKDFRRFKKAYFNVIKNNFPKFLKTKMLTFINASGIEGDVFSALYPNVVFDKINTKPIVSYEVRKFVYKILEGRNSEVEFKYGLIYRLINNLFIVLSLIALIFIYAIIKKKLFYFLLTGMLLFHTFIVFISSPGSYFMYYFNIYITGGVLGILFIIDLIYYKKNKKSFI